MASSNQAFRRLIFLLGVIMIVPIHCQKEVRLPEVTTKPMLGITYSNIQLGGYVYPGDKITSKGICWSLDSLPTIGDNFKEVDLTTFGGFEIEVTEFILDTVYFFRAYAINRAGIAYGETRKFRTYWGTVKDLDGNIYIAVRIGNQIWMGEDLRVTKYQNNDPIPQIKDKNQWANLTSGGYCNPDSFLHEVEIYGLQYNFYAVTDNRKIAPLGWHIPSREEWIKLSNYLGGESVAGGKLKEAGDNHWQYPNTGATDEYIFTALPGGIRTLTGDYQRYNYYGFWWSSTMAISGGGGYSIELFYNKSMVYQSYNSLKEGLFVRCIKD